MIFNFGSANCKRVFKSLIFKKLWHYPSTIMTRKTNKNHSKLLRAHELSEILWRNSQCGAYQRTLHSVKSNQFPTLKVGKTLVAYRDDFLNTNTADTSEKVEKAPSVLRKNKWKVKKAILS